MRKQIEDILIGGKVSVNVFHGDHNGYIFDKRKCGKYYGEMRGFFFGDNKKYCDNFAGPEGAREFHIVLNNPLIVSWHDNKEYTKEELKGYDGAIVVYDGWNEDMKGEVMEYIVFDKKNIFAV